MTDAVTDAVPVGGVGGGYAGLTVQEPRHRLAHAICHGGRGQISRAYREGQEDQLAALD
ncbi:transposase Tn3 [Streptomyces sp. L-9-10]|nr:transposase Tn3 [Streptomyces sp. L-9-10]